VQIGVSRTITPKRESDFLSIIRTAVNAYYTKIDMLPESKMFDVETQRDLARECVLEIDSVLAIWRTWRAKK
jgi:hypothetical protein